MTELDNFKKEKKTIALAKANVYGFLLLIPITIVYLTPFYFLWEEKLTLDAFNNLFVDVGVTTGLLTGLLFLLVVMVGVVFHELIHGITWAIFTKRGFQSIKFGILKEMLTPYCHCQEPLKLKQYMLGAMMPGLAMGVLPWLISLLVGSVPLFVFAIFFTMAAMGDLMIVQLIFKENPNSYVLDHPSEAGCFVYRPIDNGDHG